MKNMANKCVDVVNELMGYALGSKYVQNVFISLAGHETESCNLKLAITWSDPGAISIINYVFGSG